MAGDWIKMRGNLWDDPRVTKIVDMTDSSEAAVVGSLYWLWATADQHTEDGFMQGLTLKSINRKTGVPGFAEALCAINWLEDREDGVFIVDFEKHNGSSAKKRCQTAKRVANHAAANGKPAKCADSDNAPITQDEHKTNADSVSSALAREEKRREEEIPSVAIATASEAGKKAADADSADKTLPKPAHDLTKVELWAAGKSILAQQGMPKAQCGSFVGKLVKDYGDTIVIEAVRAAVVQQPADVAQYLKATCQHGFGTRKPINKQEALEARNRAVGEAWATEMEAKQGANLETV